MREAPTVEKPTFFFNSLPRFGWSQREVSLESLWYCSPRWEKEQDGETHKQRLWEPSPRGSWRVRKSSYKWRIRGGTCRTKCPEDQNWYRTLTNHKSLILTGHSIILIIHWAASPGSFGSSGCKRDAHQESSSWARDGLRTLYMSFCCFSVAQLCLTLCGPVDCSTAGFPLHH